MCAGDHSMRTERRRTSSHDSGGPNGNSSVLDENAHGHLHANSNIYANPHTNGNFYTNANRDSDSNTHKDEYTHNYTRPQSLLFTRWHIFICLN